MKYQCSEKIDEFVTHDLDQIYLRLVGIGVKKRVW
jgi:hypothetical protein